MKNNNKKTLFWTSYSDLMTSLFFIMLVLFVVVAIVFGKKNHDLTQTNYSLKETNDSLLAATADLERIMHLKEQFEALKNPHLEYDEDKCIFYVKDFQGIEIFERLEAEIKQDYLPIVDDVGNEIKKIIDSLNKDEGNFKFQLVIEGTAAIPDEKKRDHTYNPDSKDEYVLSYKRALALYDRWKHLNLRDGNTEIIIAGSGFNGINRDDENENNNKRFIIQIIPKIAAQ